MLGNSPCRRFLRTSRQFRPPQKIRQLAIKGKEEVDRVLTKQASASVFGSLVCLSFLLVEFIILLSLFFVKELTYCSVDCEAPVLFSGYVVRSDGIVATSTNCLSHLKGTEHKVRFGRKTL
ncbi:hypothetical protein RHGRI_013250 [Rhododendron griersonianum]|uniref:Uncharacterized protein n=1 Tax=Rhododendron griersonianum TaxID=479676 RepID=A0AAV6K4W0_9ERIC|nr:hypothetical protein RHGRI_013250 [Rhododendron griersonianum]